MKINITFLLFAIQLQFTRNVQQGMEPTTMFMQLLYDIHKNTLEQMTLPSSRQIHTPQFVAISNVLKRFSDMYQNAGECVVFPSIRDIVQKFEG